MPKQTSQWQFWIDRGGTFTDIIGVCPKGQLHIHKLLSENPGHYRNASIQGIREILKLDNHESLPADTIKDIRMGTTIATNALLERKGANIALLISKGFADALTIAFQQRPDIFALNIKRPDNLFSTVIEIEERIDYHGKIIQALDIEKTKNDLRALSETGIKDIAIVLLHSYQYPQHELQIIELARSLGFEGVSASHQLNPLIGLIGRGHTTVVDAYLTPCLHHYISLLQETLADTKLNFMQSNGGLCDAAFFTGKNAILSGPAGGIVGAVETAKQAGEQRIIAFDMGGTSTDVSHFNGEYAYRDQNNINGLFVRTAMLDIHTVAAGGGSICYFDGARLRVGPESAGANPGPACYGLNGPLTVTDCNVMLGKIDVEFFPHVFGHDRKQALDCEVVKTKFLTLCTNIFDISSVRYTPESLANAFLEIAIEHMTNAIKKISTQRGHNIHDYILNSFGGAGGQHACLVADKLGINKILLSPLAGVLSAYGIGLSNITHIQDKTINLHCKEENYDSILNATHRLKASTIEILLKQDIDKERISSKSRCHLRYKGGNTSFPVALQEPLRMIDDFQNSHDEFFGFKLDAQEIIIDKISIEATAKTTRQYAPGKDPKENILKIEKYKEIDFNHQTLETPFYSRALLPLNKIITGPAIIVEKTSTIVLEPGWQAKKISNGSLLLNKLQTREKHASLNTRMEPGKLELFNNIFKSIAEDMGVVLAKSAHSVNIKERLDFSCALFSAKGELIANAPHVPVHLGSMSASVKSIMQQFLSSIKPGDVYLVNSPYHGGTHLPDLTVVTPVFNNDRPIFFTASRAHHADVGGITPGSIPPFSDHIEQEGVLIEGIKIVEQGQLLEDKIKSLFLTTKPPARNIQQNIADLQAQIAANNMGKQELLKTVEQYGLNIVNAYMRYIQDNAEQCIRKAITSLKPGEFVYQLDNNAQIQIKLLIDYKMQVATIDFTGTSKQQNNNFNAPLAVCKAAVLYVFRTLINDDIPLNEGCMKPLRLIVPEGSMLNPHYPAAVVAGNVETSQAIVDALYGAMGILAGSQGTMNNFIFGNDDYQYYETICGGAGAGPYFDGCDAVHTHMTNSRLTDAEILESRFPVRVNTFAIRQNSGGKGNYRGGNGVKRIIEFQEPMEVSIISNNRKNRPFGLHGGQNGASGINRLLRPGLAETTLDGCAHLNVSPGDCISIETPGGGGFGPDKNSRPSQIK